MKKLIFILLFICCSVQVSFAENKDVPAFKIGVNRFAWYAALQVINFMPLSSADPFSGVIITDWYTLNDHEKYKIDIYILEEALTSKTVDVKIFKQIKKDGEWENVVPAASLSHKIEDAILNTARQLRVEYVINK